MDKQKVIEILQTALDDCDYSDATYTRNFSHSFSVAIRKALAELKKPDASEDRIRIKDETMYEVIKWLHELLAYFSVASFPKESNAAYEQIEKLKKAREA